MSEVYITLTDEDQAKLNRICVDRDPQEALDFVLKVVAAKVDKKKKSRMTHNVIDLD